MNCDGAARGNPGPAGCGVVIATANGRILERIAEAIGVATNNVAEYRAAEIGLVRAAELRARSVLLRSDSKLLVEQLSGRFRVKNPTLQLLHARVREAAARIGRVDYERVPRELNRDADKLANEAVDAWLEAEGASYRPPGPAPRLWPDRG